MLNTSFVAELTAQDESSDNEGSDIDPRDFDSDSDSEGDNNYYNNNEQNHRRGAGDAQTATTWERIADISADQAPPINNFTGQYGPLFQPDDAAPVKYFENFFQPNTDAGVSLWELLVNETNKYQELYKRKNPVLKPASKVHQWQDVTVPQMKAFIGCVLNMGINRKHTIEEYWNTTDWSQDFPMFRHVFKLDTFKLILRFFHVSDSDLEPPRGSPNYDQLYKFRPVLDHFNAAWAREFNLGREVSIDETIVGFKGRHSLVNYIRIKKHHQWGPKEYNLCDSKTGYCYETMYHTKTIRRSDHGQPFDVCDRLMAKHANKHHHLVIDNYYTSVILAEKMLEKGIYVTGTIQPNRVRLPADMKTKLKNKGEIVANRKGNLLAVNWVDRKQVRLLSTCSTASMVEKTLYDGSTQEIPKVVVDYNRGMGGVDLSDQMTDAYAGEFRTVKLWKKVVFHLIDRTCTNAYTCYRMNNNIQGKRLDHLHFLIKVVEGLIGDYREPRKRAGRPSLLPPAAKKTERHFLSKIPDGKRKKCVVCGQRREEGYKGSRITTWCEDCGVGLCKGECFAKFHK